MVNGMTGVKKKITISVDPEVLGLVQAAVADGAATSVSAFFEQSALSDLDAEAAFDRLLDEALERSGGPMTSEEEAMVDRELGHIR
jgi:hypothetical protein